MLFWGDFFTDSIPWDENHHQITINLGEYVLPHDGSMGRLVRIFTYMNGGFFMVKSCTLRIMGSQN